MNKKQCPKCGEENPAEAVMCWACYTPLSGTVSTAGAAPRNPGAAAGADSEEDKKTIPPWQLGVIGVGLLIAIGMGVRSMMPAPASDDGAFSDIPVDAGGAVTQPAAPPNQSSSPVMPAPGGTSTVTPTEAPFKVVVPPNPKLSVATMAIVPNDSNTSGPMAASYAAYARIQHSSQMKNWNTLYIYVFSDAQSAQTFAGVMKQRRGEALTDSEFSSLSSLWGSALARYEYSVSGGRRVERVLYPSKSPNGWWH